MIRSALAPSRRALLGGALAGAGALALPRRARASVSGADRKFVFVFAAGGWDPSMTLAEDLDNPALDLEDGAERGLVGGISFVDHADRPSVRAYLEDYGARTAILNGVALPTISHEIGHYLAMTGGRDGLDPDWPCILGAARADLYPAPVLIISGPSYPGALGGGVLRCGLSGQLEGLLSGELLGWTDEPIVPLSEAARDPIAAYVAARAASRVSGAAGARDRALAEAFQRADASADAIREIGDALDLSPVETLVEGAPLIARVLASGMSRCVTIGGPPTFIREWDTHNTNFSLQSALWEDLFAGLVALNQELDASPGTAGGSLADETVVVVLSEMGRGPRLNAFEGKDHWQYTSVLVSGSGVAGGRVIGGHDERWAGLPVDHASGDLADGGRQMTGGSVGAALLQLGDVDPGDWLEEAPLLALLEG